MIKGYLIILFAIAIVFATADYAYAQETKNINVEIKYTNGDIVDVYETELLVYQEFQDIPIIKKQITTNPHTISLPQGQKYKIDVLVNGMYGGTGYVDLKKESESTVINIPLSGGIKFNVFFEDGYSPIQGATVIIKSHDGKKWRESQTNEQGETLRYWMQSTTKEADHYIAEVYLEDILVKTSSNIKIQEGIAQEQKIIAPVPKIIEDLVTITLYKSQSEKVSKDDGEHMVTLSKTNSDFSKKSKATVRGEAYFSNLEPGKYTVAVFHSNEEWEEGIIIILGNQNEFEIIRTIQPESTVVDNKSEKAIQSCNCVTFRFDDVQDHWLNNVQKTYVRKFLDSNVLLTVGIIANSFGSDSVITDTIKEGIKTKKIEIANHGMENTSLEGLSKEEQAKHIRDSGKSIQDTLKINSKVFIPPQNRFDDTTKQVLMEEEYTHISSSVLFDNDFPYPLANQTLYRFPETTSTGKFDVDKNIFVGIEHTETFQQAVESLEKYGFAVITSHPQEFSLVKDGTYTNEVNSEQFGQLELLIDKIKSEGIRIVPISKINEDSAIPTWVKNNAKWWADGTVDDDSFVQGIEFLIEEGIMKIHTSMQEPATNVKKMPDWVKNNAKWWADGLISDSEFIEGMKFLVDSQIIILRSS